MKLLNKPRCNTAQEIDKTRILNALADRPQLQLDSEPLISHSRFYVIERALASTFAICAWARAARSATKRQRQQEGDEAEEGGDAAGEAEDVGAAAARRG